MSFYRRAGRPVECYMAGPTASERFWKITRVVVGWGLIILGIIGLFLPFMQGIVLIMAGLALLSKDRPWARRWLERAKARWKQFSGR